jgi:transposase
MWSINSNLQVYVRNGATDMRRSFHSLALLVQEQFQLASLDSHLFVFFNRKADTVKCLYWDRNGYCLWSKRLEQGLFRIPAIAADGYSLSLQELNLLLEGIDLTVKRHRSIPMASVN